jgi:hypothetical protein
LDVDLDVGVGRLEGGPELGVNLLIFFGGGLVGPGVPEADLAGVVERNDLGDVLGGVDLSVPALARMFSGVQVAGSTPVFSVWAKAPERASPAAVRPAAAPRPSTWRRLIWRKRISRSR